MSERLSAAWHEIDARIHKVDFDAIWPGFSPYGFAVYDQDTACLNGSILPRDERFFGNTAINLDGKLTAIWMLEEDAPDYDRLSASLVHEMFHAHQMSLNTQGFPNDLQMLRTPQNARTYTIKVMENRLLSDMVEQNADTALLTLGQLKALRAERRGLLGDYILEEFKAETVEGCAVFVELMALRQLSEAKAQEQLNRYRRLLSEPGSLLIDIRRSAYFTGALLAYVAKQAGIAGFERILIENKTLFDMVAGSLPAVAVLETAEDAQISLALAKHQQELTEQIDSFLSDHVVWMDQACKIIGYDPMNMVRQEDRLLMKTFVMLSPGDGQEPLRLMGQTLLEMVPDSTNELARYARQS